MKIRPLHDRLIITKDSPETQTAGGLFIPNNAKEAPDRGTVVAVGKGQLLENGTVKKLTVKVGDKILFAKYSGTEVRVNGEDYLILRECDVIGILE